MGRKPLEGEAFNYLRFANYITAQIICANGGSDPCQAHQTYYGRAMPFHNMFTMFCMSLKPIEGINFK